MCLAVLFWRSLPISLPFLSEGLLFCCEHQISPLDQIMLGRSSWQGQASFAVGRTMLARQQHLRNVVSLLGTGRRNKMWSAYRVQHGGSTAGRLCKKCHAVFVQTGGPTKCAQQTVRKIVVRFVSVWFMAHVIGLCLFWCSRFISLPFLVRRASLLLRTADLSV